MTTHPRHFNRRLAFGVALACLLTAATALGLEPAFIGVNYGPFHRTGQSPDLTSSLPAEQILADLGAISKAGFRHVRTFGLDNGLNQIVPIGQRRFPHLKFFLGVYVCALNHDDKANSHSTRAQMDEAIRLANSFDAVEGIVVGNECLAGEPEACRQPVSIEQLIGDLDYVRQGLKGPARSRVKVTTAMSMVAAVKHYETQGRRVAEHCDVVMVNIYPFFDRVAVADAAAKVFPGALQHVSRLYANTGKRLMVGETGWPSAGPANGAAVPGGENQLHYLRGLTRYAKSNGVSVFLFEMFDEPWKSAFESVGPHWGLFDGDSRPKFSPPFPWASD
ncbi:MAG TPA: glycosyl hydrolase family 17 protein [Desulfobacterales bacterium]|nr:glycosyl hydrolase family 17 protein [Desulfobacterales bacterium]